MASAAGGCPVFFSLASHRCFTCRTDNHIKSAAKAYCVSNNLESVRLRPKGQATSELKVITELEREQIAAFFDSLVEERETLTLSKGWLLSRVQYVTFAYVSGEVAGMAGFLEGYSSFSVVRTFHQGKGLGRALFHRTLDIAVSKEFPYVCAAVQKRNGANLRLWKEVGGIIAGSRVVDGVDSYIIIKPLEAAGYLYLVRQVLLLNIIRPIVNVFRAPLRRHT